MPRTRGRSGSLLHSFAFRLGVAFAIVAIVASALTAGVVSAAFGTPFHRYLQQQRTLQVRQITLLIERAYRGDGRWNTESLTSVVPLLGAGTVRLEDPYGNTIWRWPLAHSVPSPTGPPHGTDHHQRPGARSTATPSPSSGSTSHDGAGDRRHDGWTQGSHPDGDRNWNGSWGSGSRSMTLTLPSARAGRRGAPGSAPVLLSSTPASATLDPVRRIPIQVDGRIVGYALLRLPKAAEEPTATAFRSDLVLRLLLGGLLAAVLSLGLGIVLALRAAAPVRRVQGAAIALTAGDRSASIALERSDEFGDVGRALSSMAESVERQEQLRQGFAAQIAHELRTPLTILRSQVEGLRLGVIEPTPDAMASLDEEVQRMSRLVADLQILGSADAAGFSLERARIDLGEVVDETVRQFAGLFEGSEVRIETRLEHVIAWIDRIRVGQIVSNLLSNALKFTPPGGRVRVELRDEEPWAVIRISDSGPGIPADELDHVFDRFFRGRGSRPGGSGIGLTVVRDLALAHGGDVEVSSDPGRGSTFVVRLPLSAATVGDTGAGPAHPLSATTS